MTLDYAFLHSIEVIIQQQSTNKNEIKMYPTIQQDKLKVR